MIRLILLISFLFVSQSFAGEISDYPVITDPASADRILIIDDPVGTPALSLVEVSDLFPAVSDTIFLDTYADLRTHSSSVSWITDGTMVYVKGRINPGDGGEGWFVCDVGNASADNQMTIFEAGSDAWLRVWNKTTINPMWHEDINADGTTGDGATLQEVVMFALSLKGAATDFREPGVAIEFPPYQYLINATVSVPSDSFNLTFRTSSIRGATFLTSESAVTMFDLPYTSGDGSRYVTFENITFGTTSTGLNTDSIAIKAESAQQLILDRCVFYDFGIAVDLYNVDNFKATGNYFWGTSRTATATAFIRGQGTSDGTGGGWHVNKCNFYGDTTNLTTNGILLHEIDGCHISNSGFSQVTNAVYLNPAGTTGKSIITDVQIGPNLAVDNLANNGRGVHISGTLGAAGFGSIKIFDSVFSGGCVDLDGDGVVDSGDTEGGSYGVVVSLTDGGSFEPMYTLDKISIDRNEFRQFSGSGVAIHGDSSSKVDTHNLSIKDNQFSNNNFFDGNASTAISAEANNAVILGNLFGADSQTGTSVVNATTNSTEDESLTIQGNDTSESNCTGEAIAYTTAGSAVFDGATNPMTAQYDIIYGGSGGDMTRLAKTASSLIGYNSSSELIQADSIALDDSDYQLCDDGDGTRQVQFVLDDITANNKRQYDCPDESGTLALLGRKTNIISSNTTLTAKFCYGYTHYITAACTVTLPAVAEGMDPDFITVGAVNAVVAPVSIDKIILDGTSLDDGDKIDNDTTAGDWASLSYYSADGWYAKTGGWNDDGAPATSCALLYNPTFTATPAVDHLAIGTFDNVDYYGLLYTPASNQDVCAVDAYISSITAYDDGLGTADDYYCRIFTINGSNQATAALGTSNVVPGESLVAATWTSANAGLFSFATPVSLTSGTTYAITFFHDGDGNLNDDPSEERSEDDYPWIGLDDENDGTGDDTTNGAQGGRISFTWSSTMPYSLYTAVDAEDDVIIKIHTDQ